MNARAYPTTADLRDLPDMENVHTRELERRDQEVRPVVFDTFRTAPGDEKEGTVNAATDQD